MWKQNEQNDLKKEHFYYIQKCPVLIAPGLQFDRGLRDF